MKGNDMDNIQEQIDKAVNKQASEFLKNVDSIINNCLEKALLSLLGLEKDSHRGYEIDHCNGRNSVFIDLLRNKAIKQCEALVNKISPELEKEDLGQIKMAFKNEYSKQLKYAIDDIARKRAQEMANEIATKQIKQSLKKYGLSIEDIKSK